MSTLHATGLLFQTQTGTSLTVENHHSVGPVGSQTRHKYRECSKFEAIRQRFPTLVQQWPNLPDSFALHGLVPSNPWRSLVHEALLALENHVSNFEFAPEAGVVHCVTDGSCSNPTVEEDSLAAWAVVQPGRGTISCGPWWYSTEYCSSRNSSCPLSYAMGSSTLGLSPYLVRQSECGGSLETRQLLQGSAAPTDFEHQDLWEQIAYALSHSSATFLIHKVPGHDDLAPIVIPPLKSGAVPETGR